MPKVEIELLPTIITVCGTVFVAAFAYMRAKRIKFFEMYFQRKADTFEELSEALRRAPRSDEELEALGFAVRKAMLYCNQDTLSKISKISDYSVVMHSYRKSTVEWDKLGEQFVVLRAGLNIALRKELQECRKFRFDVPWYRRLRKHLCRINAKHDGEHAPDDKDNQ